ncbi:MAG: hypothetical protein HC893_16615 [Chloroflexaceae bacterium]|nr:hypothetical protein [Chloroflexaceae bacterium]
MPQRHIIIDSYVTITDPTAKQVRMLLEQMDGSRLKTLSLDLPEHGNLMIVGGNERRYQVVWFPPEPITKGESASFALIDQSLSGRDVVLSTPELVGKPGHESAQLPLVWWVISAFLGGELPPDVQWEDETGNVVTSKQVSVALSK